MKIYAKHPASGAAELIEVVSVDRKARTAQIRPTDAMTLVALRARGTPDATTTCPLEYLTWIPCGA